MADPPLTDYARISELERRLDRSPSSRAFLELAKLYVEEGRLEDAVRVCADGVRRHPDYISARVLLGRIYLDLGLLDQARETMALVLEKAPDNIVARRVVAQICLEQGLLGAALERYRALLAFKPDDEEARRQIVRIYRKMGADPEKIASGEEAPPGAEPPSPLATPTLAGIYLQQGMFGKAATLYREILDADPDNAEARRQLDRLEREHPLLNPAVQLRRRKIEALSSWLQAITRR
ncbi:MAG: tetratricopeptide repeat protein [Acidobacteriota bacterium]